MFALLLLLCLPSSESAADDKSGGSPAVLYKTSFDADSTSQWPVHWLTAGGQWRIVGDKDHRARQADGKLAGNAMAALTWVNYDIRTTAVCSGHRDPWGMGVFAYWQDPGNYYRLSNFGDTLQLVRCLDGVAEVVASTPAEVGKGQPWTFRLAINDDSQAAHLRGRAWRQGQPEPASWQLEAHDFSKLRRGGAAGVWCAKARCRFDNVLIEPTGGRPVRNGDGRYETNFDEGEAGKPPRGWFALGGDWRLGGQGDLALEQQDEDTPLTFDANAFCLIAEWTNYTASAIGRCLTGRPTHGLGIAGYYQNENNHYRLAVVGRSLVLTRRSTDTGTQLLAEREFAFKDGRDYAMKLRLQSDEQRTTLSGKVWPAGAAEPAEWLAEAEDASAERFTAGAVALVAVDAACEFDDVKVGKNP